MTWWVDVKVGNGDCYGSDTGRKHLEKIRNTVTVTRWELENKRQDRA